MKETVLYRGACCVAAHPEAFALGSRALLVTGRRSAAESGALADVTGLLSRLGIYFTVFDRVSENPPLSDCRQAGRLAREAGADFVVGIGGGSALDAAKAIAVLAKDPDREEAAIFDSSVFKPALPVLAIPLTAGTGSEVNPFSVMTVGERKRSFSAPEALPRAAFLDPRYLKTLNPRYTVSTAVDAFCHCLESYLSPKSTPASEADALAGGAELWRLLTGRSFTPDGDDAAGLSEEDRLASLEAAAAAGRAITVTGTGFPHPLGYGLTLRYGTPHGFACGAFTGVYIERNLTVPLGRERLHRFAGALGTTPEQIARTIPALCPVSFALAPGEIAEMAALVSGAKNYRNAPYLLTDTEAVRILTDLFGRTNG